MSEIIYVGLGGFIGSAGRYLLSTIPIRADFPLITLLTNFAGAVLIGAIMAFCSQFGPIPPKILLFMKTGICGGFTTFSTFSLETVTLLEQHKWLTGSIYAIVSVLLCIFGVILGKTLVTVFYHIS